MVCEQFKATGYPKSRPDQKSGLTVMGFVLFLTGVVFFVAGVVDILSRIDSLNTVVLLVGGLVLYKAGHRILHHCATLRAKRERRGPRALEPAVISHWLFVPKRFEAVLVKSSGRITLVR
ncbi:hypothetical protein [Salinimonas marina]|nr:hypothetical protein [Salinimonas marina]